MPLPLEILKKYCDDSQNPLEVKDPIEISSYKEVQKIAYGC